MSANIETTTPAPTVAPGAPAVNLSVTEPAATEIKKFMSGEESLPETAGLRVRVVPGGCSGFQYSLNIEENSRQGDFILDDKGVPVVIGQPQSPQAQALRKVAEEVARQVSIEAMKPELVVLKKSQ